MTPDHDVVRMLTGPLPALGNIRTEQFADQHPARACCPATG
jgi:hypothetical protein